MVEVGIVVSINLVAADCPTSGWLLCEIILFFCGTRMPLNEASGESAMNRVAMAFIADSPDALFKGILVPRKKKNNFAKQPTGGGAVSRYQIYAYDNPDLHQLLVWISFWFHRVSKSVFFMSQSGFCKITFRFLFSGRPNPLEKQRPGVR